jgi:hypothetical protein
MRTLNHDILTPCMNSNWKLPAYVPENLLLEESCRMVERHFKMEVSEREFEDLEFITQVRNKPSGDLFGYCAT